MKHYIPLPTGSTLTHCPALVYKEMMAEIELNVSMLLCRLEQAAIARFYLNSVVQFVIFKFFQEERK